MSEIFMSENKQMQDEILKQLTGNSIGKYTRQKLQQQLNDLMDERTAGKRKKWVHDTIKSVLGDRTDIKDFTKADHTNLRNKGIIHAELAHFFNMSSTTLSREIGSVKANKGFDKELFQRERDEYYV
ncbi:DUF2481 family protein [Listeria sp. FSL L7-1582]|uniref:DUF2481 family protein n=1 Tax=Listeria portnoyi TaxID=2713504 RepID=UPI00164E54AB|nr:DUF2481 family protein [Listeria portnoyi]MBC6308138.1 DUF2481 family protein [Listeria portnoyi]